MNIEIANRLVNLRKNSNLSQEALAEKLGISRQAVSKWERAEASPDTDNLILLARIYGVSLDDLLQTEDEIPRPEPEAGYTENTYSNANTANNTSNTYTSTSNSTTENPESDLAASSAHLFTLIIDLAIVMVYLFIGCVFNAWHPGWMLFLLIPIWQTLVEAIKKHNPNIFVYPVVALVIYFILGFGLNLWHPGWVIFLTIPFYYALVGYIQALIKDNKRRSAEQAAQEEMNHEQH